MVVAAAVALVVGVVLGRVVEPGPSVGVGIAAITGVVGALCAEGWVRRVAILMAITLLGGVLVQRADHGLAHTPLDGLIATHAVATLSGVLVDDPATRTHVTRAVLRVQRVRGPDGWGHGGGRHVQVVATNAWAQRLAVLQAGDRVEIAGVFASLSERDARLRDAHIVAMVRLLRIDAFAAPGPGLMKAVNGLRNCILRGIAPMPMPARALGAGFLLGDTDTIPAADTAAFRASGLSHLLAVSGANLAFVAACVAPLLRRFALTGRFIGGVGVVVLFGAMTRFEPSVLRASAMALLVLLADRLGRPAPALRVLALATIVLLIIDPLLIFRTGFQLSLGATAGLALLSRPIAARLPGPTFLRPVFATPIAAQLGVLPVSFAVFGSVPLVAIPANALADPLAGPVTIVGFITALLGGLLHNWLPDVAAWLQYPTAGLLQVIDLIARIGARHPLAIDARAALGIGAVALIVAAWRWSRARPADPEAPQSPPLVSAPTERRTDGDHLHAHH